MLCRNRGVYYLPPAVTFQITVVYQLRPGLFSVTVLRESRGHFSGMSCHSGFPQGPFLKKFADEMERWRCTNKKCNWYIKSNEIPEICRRKGGGV